MKNPILILPLLALTLAPAHSALVAHYEFDGDFTDSEGNNNLTAIGDAVVTGAAAPFNGGTASLLLDGDGDRAQIADNAALSITGALSLAAWVRPDNFSNSAAGIISKYTNEGGDQRAYNLRLGGAGNSKVLFGLSPTGTFNSRIELLSSVSLVADMWNHIAVTFDPSNSMKIYINGVEDTSSAFISGSAAPAGIADTTAPLRIGLQFSPEPQSYFDGEIDDARIYSNTLSASAVADLVPEPSSALLGVLGLAGFLVRRRR